MGREAGASYIGHDLRTAGAARNISRHSPRALEGLRTGQNHVVADDAGLDTRAALTADPAGVEAN